MLLIAAASPALADVPEGWSDPDPVPGLRALLVYAIAPLAVIALVTLLTLMPMLAGRAKAAPAITDPAPERTTPEVPALERAEPEHTSLDELLKAHESDLPEKPAAE